MLDLMQKKKFESSDFFPLRLKITSGLADRGAPAVPAAAPAALVLADRSAPAVPAAAPAAFVGARCSTGRAGVR